MRATLFRTIAKSLSLAAVAAGLMLASSPDAFAASASLSDFAKEQMMSPSQRIDRWTTFIKEASRRFGLSEEWIRAVMRMESGGKTLGDDKRPITSSAGAMGIMQIMPATYREMRQQYGLGADPYDPHDNVIAGTAYLRWLHDKYGYPKMFAAYNAGPGTLEAQFAGARNLPDETRNYVAGIARILGTQFSLFQSAALAAAEIPKGPAMLTRPDGSAIAIEGKAVDSIRASLPGEYAPGVQTVVAMGNMRQGVREDLATVASLLKSRGANV
jgi:soluble lytic murein transglycosylase-like protein